ncbi:uncharacterized protein LOC133858842 [Alnus glutinosa]|uniref:uncharacterized protein LOC133858842 n=1 Tax=Alnus glutinosa TaxID=3517 RepID=UPI002D7953D5|nr:uncharacterized protein LOC133858842 [Alnus glutinosa]XP_062150281.1 uncharacterized protein LOC133858842 [Alnus glutinosa]XP_062150282.1 uncharacterized protein LOC133858842 [Alnus glutinosa]
MESFGGSKFAGVGCPVRKKRSRVSRRPHPDSQTLLQRFNFFPSSTQLFGSGRHNENKNATDKVVVSDGLGAENKLKKLKLKVGGVTHTIHAKSSKDISGDSLVTNFSHCFNGPKHHEKQLLQDTDANHVHPLDKGIGLKFKWKDFPKTGSSFGKEYSTRGMTSKGSLSLIYEPVRKSNRVPKRRVFDVGVNDNDDEDEEIRYLGRLNASKMPEDYEDEKISQLTDGIYGDSVEYYGSPRSGNYGRKKSRSEKVYEDKDYLEEEKEATLDEFEYEGKKFKKGSLDLFVEGRNVSTPTTRNRAFQSGKDVLSGSGLGLTDLSNGASSKRKKEKLSEVEQQLKRSEAAQRRRMQSEKAAREAEAEAIRKILGQDSGRKKREEKMKKRQDELAQGKAANAITLASNSVRWVIGPTGTIVTFSEDMGLPSIFDPVPCSYPPPREKCAGPNCTNSYKYRDSKWKLPLCSLHCYRAVHQKMQPLLAC